MSQHANSGQPGPFDTLLSDGEPVRRESGWHKTSTLPDGTPIGRLGAYWYVLDEDGRAISDGYHEISLDENGEYQGKRSARTERIELYTEPDHA